MDGRVGGWTDGWMDGEEAYWAVRVGASVCEVILRCGLAWLCLSARCWWFLRWFAHVPWYILEKMVKVKTWTLPST